MRYLVFSIVLLQACVDGGASEPNRPPSSTVPATGAYASQYRVPSEDPSLAAAAVYPVDHVDWTVIGNDVTLHYELPLGLVGGKLDVTFTGTIQAGSDTFDIAGANGTGTCTVTKQLVTCLEHFTNLGTLPISQDVIAQRAAIEYPGPVNDRMRLATLFGSDPIGIVEIFADQPIVDDNTTDDD